MRYLLSLALLLVCSTAQAQLNVAYDATDVFIPFRMLDSTDGTPETGVTTATGGIAAYYQREGEAAVSITLGDASDMTTHAEGDFEEDRYGEYQLCAPDAAFTDTGSQPRWVKFEFTATDMVGKTVLVNLQYGATVGSDGLMQTNVKKVNDTTQTANDNGADINAILADTGTDGVAIADGSITEAKFADVSEPTAVPPTSSINPMEMLKYLYFYGAGINKTDSDLTNGEGEMQYYDSGGTKRFERDVTKSGTVTTKDEVRAND